MSRAGAVVGGSAAPEILDDDAEAGIETVARAAVTAVQDVFAEELGEPWPARAGAMPDADARVEGHRLTVWFGAESAPALTLAPVPLGP